MEGLPEITRTLRVPLRAEIPGYMMDHHSRAGVILPAVEIMEILASSALESVPGTDIMRLSDARFDRFIPLAQGQGELDCACEIDVLADGSVRAKLQTKAALKGGMTRTKEHASVVFGQERMADIYPADMACCIAGVAFEVSAEVLYRELVPFGPSYRNLTGTLYLSEEGAIGGVVSGDIYTDRWPLGSPFPLDGAFHAACAWGQRYAGFVPFPVAFASRRIHSPIMKGESLVCRIVPLPSEHDSLMFDLYITRMNGELCESVNGLVMKDVSGGKAAPPEWVRSGARENHFTGIAKRCTSIAVIERKTVAPFASGALTPEETRRFSGMGQRRAEGFIAARLCCKRMSRSLSGNDLTTAAGEINTIDGEGIRPRCLSTDRANGFPCSASHDSRFAFSASCESGAKIGVDVEGLTDRVLRGRRFFMSESEMALSEASGLGGVPASLRIWSIKECVTKALDLKLYESWRISEVLDVGEHESTVVINGNRFEAYHDQAGDHLFTVLVIG